MDVPNSPKKKKFTNNKNINQYFNQYQKIAYLNGFCKFFFKQTKNVTTSILATKQCNCDCFDLYLSVLVVFLFVLLYIKSILKC